MNRLLQNSSNNNYNITNHHHHQHHHQHHDRYPPDYGATEGEPPDNRNKSSYLHGRPPDHSSSYQYQYDINRQESQDPQQKLQQQQHRQQQKSDYTRSRSRSRSRRYQRQSLSQSNPVNYSGPQYSDIDPDPAYGDHRSRRERRRSRPSRSSADFVAGQGTTSASARAGKGAGKGAGAGVGANDRELEKGQERGQDTAPASQSRGNGNTKGNTNGNRKDNRRSAYSYSYSYPSPSPYQPPPDNVTPGADNFSKAASGGVPALAYTIAENNPRQSGVAAMSGYGPQDQRPPLQQPYPQSYQRSPPQQASPYDQQSDYSYEHSGAYEQGAYDRGNGYNASPPPPGYPYPGAGGPGGGVYDASSHSLAPVGSGSVASGAATPTRSHHSYHSYSSDPFGDPHAVYSQRMDPSLGNLQINPNEIDDDGDDGLDYRRPTRNSMLSMGHSSSSGGNGAAAAAAAGGAAAAAGGAGVMGGLMGRNRNSQIAYDPVQNAASGSPAYNLGARAEKPSNWMSSQTDAKKKRRKWLVIVLVGLAILGAIVGGVVGGVVKQDNKSSKTGHSGQSADEDTSANGDLDINSDEIKQLMNNPDLHKVFPGVDYTPINVQYPDCLHDPPSQNNITRDVAVLSQLTDTIRLYGTDCNQTQMTIHALNQLELKDEMKIWMGVWQDKNKTTNKRQLEQMWTILDEYGSSYFKGVIVANEILFREEMTTSELGTLLDSVRKNLSAHNWEMPVATSDLGDDWTAELAKVSDYIMSNIHPFFAGVNAKTAASWTYSFWENQNAQFFKSDIEKNIISEVGWPTKGGTNCGSDAVTDCPNGSVAGIEELNQLLDDWVCQALSNGTNYFWFEMFDEPWKVRFNEPEKKKEWEDQWGIMDVNRNLKPGVKIPDCGGKTVSSSS